MLSRRPIFNIMALLATRPESFTINDACREHIQNMRRAGPVTSHVIDIGPKVVGESEMQRGQMARELADARFPGCIKAMDVDATDYKAGKIVVLVADAAREDKAC